MMRALAIAAVALAACSPEIVERPQPQYADWKSLDTHAPLDAGRLAATAKEREIATRYLAALAAPGYAGLSVLLDEDSPHFTNAGKDDAYTRADIVAAHDKMFGGYEPRAFTATRVLITDSVQVIEWTLVATEKQTQRQASVRGVSLLETKDDGTIRQEKVYFDKLVLDGKVPTAPAGKPAATPELVEQQSSPDEQSNLAIVQVALDDHLENDEAKYAEAFAGDAEVFTEQDAQPIRGQAGAHAYWTAMQQTFARLKTTFISGQGIGAFVFVEYYVIGEQRRKYNSVPPPKSPLVKVHLVDVVELRKGKIARAWRYDNPIQLITP